nr:hypothetical protein [uncultured Dongia sp.]
MAEFAHSAGLRAHCLRKGIQISSAIWKEFGERYAVEHWTHLGTRPLLRALFDLASLYHEVGGHAEAAIEYLQALLQLDPLDHLGAQAILEEIRSDLSLAP